MNIDPKGCKIMLTEPPMNPLKNRQKMIEVSNVIFCDRARTGSNIFTEIDNLLAGRFGSKPSNGFVRETHMHNRLR